MHGLRPFLHKRRLLHSPLNTVLGVLGDSFQVITAFILRHEKDYVAQGSFDVADQRRTTRFPTQDGFVLRFDHNYEGQTCFLNASITHNETVLTKIVLEFPINRSKLKWKEANLGSYHLYYRSRITQYDDKKRRTTNNRVTNARIQYQSTDDA